MKHILGASKRASYGTVAALFMLLVAVVAIPPQTASAAGLLNRSLTLTSSQPGDLPTTGSGEEASDPGDASNGAQVGHTYGFEVRTTGNIQALKFQYCDGPFGYLAFDDGTSTCSMSDITGFSAANADVGATVSVWSDFAAYEAAPTVGDVADGLTFATSGTALAQEVTIAATSAQAVTAGDYILVEFNATAGNYFVNPSSTANDATFFAHIETYATTAAAGSEVEVDEGTVASSTADTIAINTRVAESLKFSVTADTPVAEDTTCDALTGNGEISMGDPTNDYALSASQTYDAYSYFRLATNSARGAKVLYAGETLKSTAGDEIAAADAAGEASALNTEQFGLAISVASDGTGDAETANDVLGTATPGTNDLVYETGYGGGAEGFTTNNANGTYAFDTTSNGVPVPIATSTDVVSCDTGVVRYIANISNNTPAGLYSTKISYIAAPAF